MAHNIKKGRPTLEGAGVLLQRIFGNQDVPIYDPFLLLDDFRGDDPADYSKGFPWHPHRGIETITYVLAGEVDHGDSLGNSGVIGPGDVQWMTAGSGIIHQEMPRGDETGKMYGFQLWANLPARLKMTEPRYQDITASEIPVIEKEEGVRIKVICGELDGVSGPVKGVAIDPVYADININAAAAFTLPLPADHISFCYIFQGSGSFNGDSGENRTCILFEDGKDVTIHAGSEGVRFLFIAGKPLKEPVAWGGPIVMNTQEELQLAFDEYEAGTFLKHT